MFWHRTRSNVVDNAPGPSPWYLRSNAPRIVGFEWVDAGETDPLVGKMLLVDRSGPVLVLEFGNYVSVINHDQLLIWHQRYQSEGPSAPVRLYVLNPKSLAVIPESIEAIGSMMKASQMSTYFQGSPLADSALPTTTVRETLNFSFPEPISGIEELLILCNSSGIDPSPGWETSNLALLVAHPRLSRYRLYPQVWFNTARLDYGYQWVTRVARNPVNGRVHGDGIRIAPFVLDESLEQCA